MDEPGILIRQKLPSTYVRDMLVDSYSWDWEVEPWISNGEVSLACAEIKR